MPILGFSFETLDDYAHHAYAHHQIRNFERFLAMYDANEQEFNVGHLQALADDASALGGHETDYQKKKRLQKSQPVFIDFPERTKQRSIPKKTYTCPVFNCPDPIRNGDAGLHLALAHSMSFCRLVFAVL